MPHARLSIDVRPDRERVILVPREDLRDGALGDADYRMVDGVGAVALPLGLIGSPRLLPAADVDS